LVNPFFIFTAVKVNIPEHFVDPQLAVCGDLCCELLQVVRGQAGHVGGQAVGGDGSRTVHVQLPERYRAVGK